MPSNEYIGDELDLFARARNWKRYWTGAMRPFLGKRILDVGAGIGGTAAALASIEFSRYLALEPDPSNVARMDDEAARGSYAEGFETMIGTIDDLSSSEMFDTILYIDVLEHIAGHSEELQKAARHLSHGGRIIVLAPAHQWLYSAFDKAVGHERRYDRASLLAAKPAELATERLSYLDSVGLLASGANRLLLKSAHPTASQIQLWDGFMVPASRWVDRLTGFRFGKSILGVFRKGGPGE